MDGAEDVSPRAECGLDGIRLQREQQSCCHWQGKLFSQCRRLSDAIKEGPAPTGSAIFSRRVAQITPCSWLIESGRPTSNGLKDRALSPAAQLFIDCAR